MVEGIRVKRGWGVCACACVFFCMAYVRVCVCVCVFVCVCVTVRRALEIMNKRVQVSRPELIASY